MFRVTHHIDKLLSSHDCVIVPGLGGFVGNYQSAKIHPTSYIFNSPSKSIAFNVNLKNNDGLLVNSIVNDEKVTLQAAETEIRMFVDQIQDALREHKPVKLPGIGRLTVDIENHIQFIPDNSQNFLNESYGLYSFTAQPISREKETVSKQAEAISIKPEKKRKSFSDVFLPIAAVLLLVLITVQIYIQSTIEGYNYAEILGLNKLFNKEEVTLDRYKPVEMKINNSILKFRAVDTLAVLPGELNDQTSKAPINPVNETVTQPAKYLLIAGALNNTQAAQQIIDRLQKKNYNGYILARSGYQMVAIAIPDNVSPSTYRSLFIDDTGITDAWVTRNK